MSLDIVLLGSNGKPELQVPIELKIHYKLLADARKYSLSLLLRLNDYYVDAVYSLIEYENLLNEIDKVCSETKDKEMLEFLERFKTIVRAAIEKKLPLEVIAD